MPYFSNRSGLLAVVVLVVTALAFLFPGWFQHPNSRVIEGYGDGYKAYHAILYHAKYDSTYSWYEGMNYPYGEHVVPGASQPLVSNGMKLMEAVGIPAADYGFAVVHFSMLLGILLAAVFTYLLLVRLGASVVVAVIGGILITGMAPQLDRIIAHYGLAHPEVIPATLYFLRRWDEDTTWMRALPVALCVAIFSGIHFYYFAILAFLIGGWLGARWIISREWKRWWYYGWTLFLMFGLPAAGYFTWFGLTDPVSDRNEAPWGFFEFHSNPLGILTSHTQPHGKWLQSLFDMSYPGFEGWAYIGLPAILFLAWAGLRWFSRIPRSFPNPSLLVLADDERDANGDGRWFLGALTLSAFVILLFSFGLPLTRIGGAEWLEKLGPLRQFRSVGRFAWIFYYAVNIWMWVEIGRYLDRKASKEEKGTVGGVPIKLLPLILIAAGEVFFFWRAKDFRLDEVAGLNPPTLAQTTGLDFANYQAIIPVPYYNIGSDNFWWDQSGFIGQKVQTLSWQTGLSTTGAMLTRTSLGQTLKQLQLITEPYRPPALLDDLPDERPFLLAYDAERYGAFGDRSDHLTQGAELLYADEPFRLYALPLDSWKARLRQRYNEVRSAVDSGAVNGDSLVATGQVIYRNFSLLHGPPFPPQPLSARHSQAGPKGETGAAISSQASTGYHGPGYYGDLGEVNVLLDTLSGIRLDSGDYVLSFWMDVGHDRYARSEFTLQTRRDFQQPGPAYSGAVHRWVRVMDVDGWALVEMPLTFTQTVTGLRLTLRMPLLKGRPLRVDDVLLRPADTDVYQRMGDTLYHNNRYYPPLTD